MLNRADGAVIAYAGVPLPDGGTLLTYIDITDSKRAELALIERNEALEAADRLKNSFLSHVSYELRTPLTNIIGFSEMLANPRIGPLNPKQREYLNDIRTSSMTLLTIINDILDLAVIDAGALELNMAPVSVREVIDAAELGVRDRLAKMGLKLEIHLDPEVDQILADGQRLTQILFNLLSNAIGFSEEGNVITLNCRREQGHGDVHGAGYGLRHPGGVPEDGVRALREPSARIGPPRRGAGAVAGEEPGGAAWRRYQAALGAGRGDDDYGADPGWQRADEDAGGRGQGGRAVECAAAGGACVSACAGGNWGVAALPGPRRTQACRRARTRQG